MAVERGGDNGRGYMPLPDVAMARPKASRPSASGAAPRVSLRASRRNAKQAHALWMPVDPPGSGRNREGKGLRMARGRSAASVLGKGRTGMAGRGAGLRGSATDPKVKAIRQRQGANRATARMRKGVSNTPASRTGGLKNYGPTTPGGSIGQAHQSFFDIGNFLKNLGR